MRSRRAIGPGEKRYWYNEGGKRRTAVRKKRRYQKGKYRRTRETRERCAKVKRGKISNRYRFTLKDERLQKEEMKKLVKVTQADVLAGSIPRLSDMISYARNRLEKSPEYKELKKDNARLQKVLAIQSMAIVEYSMGLWEKLPAKQKTAKKFYSYFVKSYKDLAEEARKAIDSANEIEFGKKLTVSNKGKFEDDLEKAINVTPVKEGPK